MNFIFPREQIFDKYLNEYYEVPQNKLILHNMIKFKDMYQNMYTLPYLGKAMAEEETAVKRAEVYMLRRDLVKTFDDITGKKIVVTTRGHKIFYREYPLARLRKEKWDGIWTIVMYDIPEKLSVLRNRLRRRLKNLGFGCIQKSILISPLPYDEDIQKFIEGEGQRDYVWTLSAKSIFGLDNQEIAKKAWPKINEIFELYNLLNNILPKIKEIKKNSSIIERWKEYFLAVNFADPHLPYELLDIDWPAEVCENNFIRLGTAGFLKLIIKKIKNI